MSRILLIDDDDQFRGMLRQALRPEGYEVVEARDGKEGLIRFRTAAIDLVITDILMPEQEGLQTIRELRAEFPAIKIIAISGDGAQGTLNFSQNRGALWGPMYASEALRLRGTASDNLYPAECVIEPCHGHVASEPCRSSRHASSMVGCASSRNKGAVANIAAPIA
jgi:CheY-like chemotaxis protein